MSQAEAAFSANPRKITRLDILQLLLRGRAFIALILVMIVFSFMSDTFLTTQNMIIMAKQVAVNAIVAIGMTYVILTGGIDLSVGSVVGLTAMLAFRRLRPGEGSKSSRSRSLGFQPSFRYRLTIASSSGMGSGGGKSR